MLRVKRECFDIRSIGKAVSLFLHPSYFVPTSFNGLSAAWLLLLIHVKRANVDNREIVKPEMKGQVPIRYLREKRFSMAGEKKVWRERRESRDGRTKDLQCHN